MPGYLFIVRSFNDTDHMTPLVDYLCRSKKRLHLYTYTRSLLYAKNENLDYLKREHGISPRSFLYDIKMPWHQHVLLFIFTKILLRVTNGRPHRLNTYVTASFQKAYARDKEWADRRIAELKPSVIILDGMMPALEPVVSLIKSAKKNNIPIITVPHGLNVFTSSEGYLLDHKEMVKEWRMKREHLRQKGIWFDYTISQGPVASMHLLNQGYKPEEIIPIGSMRYSREWMEKYSDIPLKKLIENKGENRETSSARRNTTNVVIFFSKMKYNGNPEKVREMVEQLASRKHVHLILKPHTRRMNLSFLQDVISKHHIEVASSISSFELSKWCDIGIVWGSSIGLQVLYDKKIMIDPLFADRNESVYEKYRAACLPKTIDELVACIEEYQVSGKLSCYSEENVQNLFRDIVYAGNLERNVIKDYADFLESIAKRW